MSDYPLLTEADEDLGPVIEAVLKAERELPASDPNRFCTLLDAIAQALYDHAVPRQESDEQTGQPSIHQIKAAFMSLSNLSPGELEALADALIFRADSEPGLTPREEYAQQVFSDYRSVALELSELLGFAGPCEKEVPLIRSARAP